MPGAAGSAEFCALGAGRLAYRCSSLLLPRPAVGEHTCCPRFNFEIQGLKFDHRWPLDAKRSNVCPCRRRCSALAGREPPLRNPREPCATEQVIYTNCVWEGRVTLGGSSG